jgi:transposase InsO family protein
MSRKLDVTEAFIGFCAFVEARGYRVRNMVYRSDAEKVFLSGAFADHCSRFGIDQQNSPPYLKQLNGFAENVFRHMWPMVKSLLNGMQVDMKYWPHAVHHATWLRNRLPDSSLGFKSPFELVFGYPPILSDVRVFFSPVFSWVTPSDRSKLSDTAAGGVYVGHSDTSGAYLVLDPGTDKLYHRGRSHIVEDSSLVGRLMSGIDLTDVTELSFVDHYTSRPAPFLKHLPVDSVHKEQRLTLLGHHAWYNAWDHECVAILQVSCHQYPAGVWMTAQTFLHKSRDKFGAWVSLARYLAYRLANGSVNKVFPLFSMVTSSVPKFQNDIPCMVVSVDISGKDIKGTCYGLVHSPDLEMDYLDVPAKHVSFPEDGISASVSMVVAPSASCHFTSSTVVFPKFGISMASGVAALAVPANSDEGYILPITHRQAMLLPEASLWAGSEAMEMKSFEEHEVFKLTTNELPPGVKALSMRPIYAHKKDADGRIDVTKGYQARKTRFVI